MVIPKVSAQKIISEAELLYSNRIKDVIDFGGKIDAAKLTSPLTRITEVVKLVGEPQFYH